ncbi:glycosyltransferase [Haloprofundus salinisoli]|uniref:glycosyltransferase n=1 Tax=Haloprofundus salinisoli TaxID=2876193 RepID=UPI001CC9974C|nr:glycosyltransferase [Haloprofundus salinisoli]
MTGEKHTVLQASKFYYPQVGGIEKVVRQLAEGHASSGYSHRVLAAGTNLLGQSERVNEIPVHRVGSFGSLQSVPLTPLFPAYLRRAARQADIVHYHVPNPVAVLSHISAGINVPTVVTYHSDIIRQKTALKLYEPVLRRFLENVDQVVTTSPRLLKHSPFLNDYREKCQVIPLAIDVTGIETSKRNNKSTGNPFVLFVGRLSYYKGVQYLVDAAVDVDADIGIVGDGDLRAELEARARDRGVTDRLTFFGRVSDEQLAALYRQADVFVLPSVEPSEAFGIVQLEAMARGVPVINTNLSTGVPWVSQDGETGLTVPPRDSDALADAVKRLLADDDLRHCLGQNARKRVESKFTEARMLEQYRRLYQSLHTN